MSSPVEGENAAMYILMFLTKSAIALIEIMPGIFIVKRLSSRDLVTSESSQGNLTQRQISILQEYIYDRIDQDIPLRELASSIGMSVSHYSRLFKQSMGLSPHQYVIACRIERAKSLLLNEERTIAQVAHAVGFTDQSHLNRHFKQVLGIAPGALRKESKNIQKQEKNVQDNNGYKIAY